MSDRRSGSRVLVALTFDFDVVSPWLHDEPLSPSSIARAEFGVIGVERVRRVLDEYGVKGTFFTPGHTAVSFPGALSAVVSDGHEVGHHGWAHETFSLLTEAEERSAIERGLEGLESVAGVRPTGFRAPEWEVSPRTIDLLVEYGFSYDSSLMGNDFSPYWCRSGAEISPEAPFVPGDRVDLVEVPVGWHLDDFPYFELLVEVPNMVGLRTNEDLLEIWKAEFVYLYEEVREGCMTVTMHPQSIGRGHRILALREFVEFVLDHPEARFVPTGQIADGFRAVNPLEGPGGPSKGDEHRLQ